MAAGTRPRVVIIGGGFGGLYAARALRRAPVDITLVDRRNFHLFQPLLYQVATASLNPGDIASPLRHILRRQRNVRVWLAEATDIDVENHAVVLEDGRLEYDYLILATGATHAYFGHPEWERYAPGLKSIEDAFELRRRFLCAFEEAERETDPEKRQELTTFAIVGAGPTGVELAGAMAEIAQRVMPREFRAIDTTASRVLLLEGTDRVLPGYPDDLSRKAQRQLERLGVEVRTSAFVTHIDGGEVRIGDDCIPARNVFWAAGVSASPLGHSLDVPLDPAGRVLVEPDLTVPGHREIFVIGDLAHAAHDGDMVPGVAQGAMQGGRFVARTIEADLTGRERGVFRYRDKGSLATIGRAAAVADFGRFRAAGFLAWAIWVFVHILYLIGFRNRILVMMQWGWAYLTWQRGIRLITGRERKSRH